MTTEIEQKAVEIIDRISDMAEPAMQVTLRAIQVGSIIDLVTGAVCLGLSIFIARRFVAKWWKDLQESNFDTEISRGLRFWISAVGCSLMGVISLGVLLSTSNWLGAIAPELAMARMILQKIT